MTFSPLEIIVITVIAIPTCLAWCWGLAWTLNKILESHGIDLGHFK